VNGILVTDAERLLQCFDLSMNGVIFTLRRSLSNAGLEKDTQENKKKKFQTGSTRASTNPSAIGVLKSRTIDPG